jgi:hypothetical protein
MHLSSPLRKAEWDPASVSVRPRFSSATPIEAHQQTGTVQRLASAPETEGMKLSTSICLLTQLVVAALDLWPASELVPSAHVEGGWTLFPDHADSSQSNYGCGTPIESCDRSL